MVMIMMVVDFFFSLKFFDGGDDDQGRVAKNILGLRELVTIISKQ